MPETVSIVRCADYERKAVEKAVAEAVRLAGGLDVAGKTVLLKPNMLGATGSGKPAASEPEFLRAAMRVLKAGGASRILVGDSPAVQPADMVGLLTGLKAVALDEGAEWVDFGDPVEVAVPGASLVKRFSLARVVTEVDCVVSLCRLKTHNFMYFTGAVKNLFGCIVGLQKSAMHLRFPGKAEFGTMLADLALAVKPSYAIMDAVVAMEGPGPLNGTARKVGLVLAARNVFALDWVASALVGYDPMDIPYLRASVDGDVYGFKPDGLRVEGVPVAEASVRGFVLVPVVHGNVSSKGPLGRAFRNLTIPRPYFSRQRCVLCGACVRICPASALAIESDGSARKYVAIDYSKCLRCYCCHEVCPQDAIDLKRRL